MPETNFLFSSFQHSAECWNEDDLQDDSPQLFLIFCSYSYSPTNSTSSYDSRLSCKLYLLTFMDNYYISSFLISSNRCNVSRSFYNILIYLFILFNSISWKSVPLDLIYYDLLITISFSSSCILPLASIYSVSSYFY